MFVFTGDDGLRVHVHTWLPESPAPRGVVQISHGMGEHAARYARLARHLARHGYAVYANDHRGHGRTGANAPGRLGPDGWNRLVADLVALTRLLRMRHPGLPLVLLGHSMGSYAVQHHLLRHSGLLDAAVLAGTTALDGLRSRIEAAGDRSGFYNAAFQPARTRYDWLSRDPEQVDAYLRDDLCGYPLEPDSMRDMWAAAPLLADPAGVRPGLPLYVMAGDQDPLNDRLALSDLLVARYRAAGLTDLTYRVYPGARHELLNETNAEEVTADVLGWIARVTVPGAGAGRPKPWQAGAPRTNPRQEPTCST